jgi:hypothetical protein
VTLQPLSSVRLSGMIDERRRGERIEFPEPLSGLLDGIDVEINQLSMRGCRITHIEPLAEREWHLLSSECDGDLFELECRLVRSEETEDSDGMPIFLSGLEFLRSRGISGQIVHALISEHVERALSEYRANALGLPPVAEAVPLLREIGRGGGPVRRAATQPKRRFGSHRLDAEGAWSTEVIDEPVQPANGFTILTTVEDDEVEMLRRTYEASDEEHRSLIRLAAELSLAEEIGTSALRPE